MIASKHLQFVIVAIGLLLAVYVGSNVVALSIPVMCVLGAVILLGVWMLVAGQNWWFLIFTGASIGGIMHVGFKIFPNEIAFGLALLGLLPLVLTQDLKAFQYQRKPLPAIFFITAAYVTIRLFIDVVPAAGYRGSLGRVAFDATWPFAFVFFFHHYGSLEVFKRSMLVMFWVLLVRTFGALVGFFTGLPIVIPGLNYYLSVSSEDSLAPMRWVATNLLAAALILFHSSRTFFGRVLIFPVCFFACGLEVMGGGRFAFFATTMLPLFFLAWSRRWALLFLLTSGAFFRSGVYQRGPRKPLRAAPTSRPCRFGISF